MQSASRSCGRATRVAVGRLSSAVASVSAGRILNLVCPVALLAMGMPAVSSAAAYLPGVQVGTMTSPTLAEVSGIAASRVNPGVVWVHNDRGNTSQVFALSTGTPATGGQILGTYTLAGATNIDWEDIAAGPGTGPGALPGVSYLYVGDIGNNPYDRSSYTVYRVPEPTLPATTPVSSTLTDITPITLTLPDPNRDIESLMVDPISGDILVVTKRFLFSVDEDSRIYRATSADLADGSASLVFDSQLAIRQATAGDISPDGLSMLIRTNTAAFEFVRTPGQSWADAVAAVGPGGVAVPLIRETQGEAIAYAANGKGYFATGERANQPIYFYAVVPEPGIGLGAIAAMGLALRRRRSQTKGVSH